MLYARRCIPALVVFLAPLAWGAVPVAAQQVEPTLETAQPSVRYDTDLLPAAFHRSRRDSVLAVLPDNAFAVVLSSPGRNRENSVSYEYRQSSNLYYLTGTHEPNSVLVLAPGGTEIDGDTVRELLLVPARDPNSERWTGRRFGAVRAQEELGIERAVTNDRFEEVIAGLLEAGRRLYHLPLPRGVVEGSTLHRQIALLQNTAPMLDIGNDPMTAFVTARLLATDSESALQRNRATIERMGPERLTGTKIEEIVTAYVAAESLADWLAWKQEKLDGRYADGQTLRERLNALRMVKTQEELELLRRAIDITVEAHREAMKSLEPGMHEYEVEALVQYVFRRNGAEHPGFPSIIGSGENSVILHYETNRRRMEDGDVVVIDIGAEYHGYTADVTRTVPVNGRFSPEQRAIYEIVLRAQEAGIEEARAGRPFSAPHQAAQTVVAEGLVELGLIEHPRQMRRFFMHGTSHYLGLYVHDVGTGAPLVPGAVITVEPGIYISPEPDIDPKWWNISVRIEDDVLITDGEPVVLSAGAPKDPEEIEALMAEAGLGNLPAGVVPEG